MTKNRSLGFDNWSQIKNLNEPFATCNVSSIINAAQSALWPVMELRKSNDPNKRPADDLYEFMRDDPHVQSFYKRYTDQKLPPNQYMEVLSYAAGLWLGSPQSVEWQSGLPVRLIGAHIINSGCAVVHGHYPTLTHDIDHINALVGVSWTADGTVYEFIVDDSWGDYRTKYESRFGDNIVMPVMDAAEYLKPLDSSMRKDAILIFNKV